MVELFKQQEEIFVKGLRESIDDLSINPSDSRLLLKFKKQKELLLEVYRKLEKYDSSYVNKEIITDMSKIMEALLKSTEDLSLDPNNSSIQLDIRKYSALLEKGVGRSLNKTSEDSNVENNLEFIQEVRREFEKIHLRFDGVHAHLDSNLEVIISNSKLTQVQKQEVITTVNTIDVQNLKTEEILLKLSELDSKLESYTTTLPDHVKKALEEAKSLNTSIGLDGKLKLGFTILGIVGYEVEVPMNLKDYAKQIWRDFKAGHYLLYPK